MRRNFQVWVLFYLGLFLVGCTIATPVNPAGQQTARDGHTTRNIAPANDLDLTEFVAFVEDSMARDNIPGVAVAVVRGSEPLLLEGFGWRNVAQQQPVTPDTLFHIGSTQKSFTALMVATLVDDDLVNWDTPAIDIYPDFELADDLATETVTLRHLLSMRSGIADEAEDDFDIDNATAEDVLPFLADAPLLGEPGEVFSYSNLSLAAAGYLAVLAANPNSDDLYTDYATLLSERVLRPIGMTNAVMRISEAETNPNYGRSYVLDDEGRPQPAEPEDWDGDPLAPSGGLKASAREMALYISTQLGQGVAPNGNRIVSAANLTETWQPYLENYGMGWETSRLNGVTVISHEGSFDNYLSVIGFLPDHELGFVILTNSEEAAGEFIEQAPLLLTELVSDQ